jgi:hypothetical protein
LSRRSLEAAADGAVRRLAGVLAERDDGDDDGGTIADDRGEMAGAQAPGSNCEPKW